MPVNGIRALKGLGQSVWYDNCERRFVAAELPRLIAEDGLPGMTSNPSIFQKAIAGSDAYDAQIRELLARNASTREMLDALTVTDIRAACDAFAPLFAANPEDGRVSLEVSPALARDTSATIAEGLRLHALVDRPNVMIKVPATVEGLPAITELTALGLDVNVTLIFSEARYRAVMDAFLAGLESRLAANQSLAGIESVASFFISRIDTAVNAKLPPGSPLRFTAGLATAKRAWAAYREVFGSARFAGLAAAGARPQRVLWASTGTKDPSLSPTFYVAPLVGPGTVTTLPPETYAATRALATVAVTIDDGVEAAARTLESLAAAGVDLPGIYRALEDAGVKSFADAWAGLTAALEARHAALAAR